MAGFMAYLLMMDVGLGLLLVALGLPLMRRKVGPNHLYGFRVRRTLRDPSVWYEANAFAGRCLIRTGIGIALASLALFYWPGIGPIAYAWGCLVISLGGIAAGIIPSFHHLDRIADRDGMPLKP